MSSIDLGHTIPESTTQGDAPLVPVQAGSSVALPARSVSLDEVQRSAGNRVLKPGYLPAPDFTLQSTKQIGPATTVQHYAAPGVRWLLITQQRGTVKRMQVSSPIQEATVSGRPAAIMTSKIPARGQPNNELRVLNCVWETADSLMQVMAGNVSVEQLIRAAEGLH